MSILSALNNIANGKKNPAALSREEIVELLKTSPEKLEAFEKMYKTEILNNDADGIPENAKQAAKFSNNIWQMESSEALNEMIDRIVNELLVKTERIIYDGHELSVENMKALPMNEPDSDCCTDLKAPVTLDEILEVPKDMQPQLTGMLMKSDMPGESGPSLLWQLSEMQKTNNMKKKQTLYRMFRQGLDILDLDPLTYEMLSMNRNSMSHWLPQLIAANEDKGFFMIPRTIIAKVPLTLLQLTRTDFMSLTQTTKDIVNAWAVQTFNLSADGNYFLKTGTYSSKFDFRNCHVNEPAENMEIGEYLLYIHFAACQMASPFNTPCIYGVSTTNEWVVREYIEDKENNPVIYKGLPLHTEYRVFIDCDKKEVLGIHPYWDPDVMKKRFDEHRDGHDEHDAIVYRAYEETLMARYNKYKDVVLQKVKELLPDLDLTGQWSLDIMQNGDEFWLIDMALAQNSAFYQETVRLEDRRPEPESWIPQID